MNVKARSGIAALVALAIAAIAATPAAADQPWGFEMVTPPVKGSGTVSYVDTFRTSPDGESLLYSANSPFSSIPAESSPAYTRYIAHRGADGWNNRALDPPFDPGFGSGAVFDINGVVGSSFNLDWVLVSSTSALTPGAIEGGGNLYMRNTRTGETKLVASSPKRVLSTAFTGLGGPMSANYVAPDGKAAIFSALPALVPDAPERSEEPTSPSGSYIWTESGGIELLSRLPNGEAVGGYSGSEGEQVARESRPNEDGLEYAYFTQFSGGGIGGVYVRSGGVTKPVSYSRITETPNEPVSAVTDAVANRGRYMLFHTEAPNQRLTTDTPEIENAKFLYRYDAVSESLDYVGIWGLLGSVGVIRMTQDGQTIAFQSSAAQLPGAVAEQPNVYVWRNGHLELAAVLDSSASSGAGAFSLRNLSANGNYLSFTDDSVSLAEEFGQATSSPNCPLPFVGGPGPCDQVYVYDVEAEELQCASCLPDGAPPAGDAGDPLASNSGYARMDGHLAQTVADDGTVFFTSKDGLLPSDKNELEDVYAYRNGDLRLLSRATQGNFSRFIEATPDGKTVFFETDDPISPTDTDRAADIYMTRAGAGFPYTPPPTIVPCEGAESCRAGVAAKTDTPSPGSATFSGRGNATGDSKARKQRVSVAKAKAAKGATASLRVQTPGAGKLTVSGAGVKTTTKSVTRAASYRLKVTLTAPAKRTLKKAGQVKKKVRVTFTPREGTASSVTLTVTYKATSTRKGN